MKVYVELFVIVNVQRTPPSNSTAQGASIVMCFVAVVVYPFAEKILSADIFR